MRQLIVAAALAAVALPAFAADKLVVLSPHRKSIQEEFVPVFKDHYKKTFGTDVEVEWLDQGGTSSAVKYLGTKVKSKPENPGIDVFWGGTASNFVDMAKDGLLAPYALSAAARTRVPKEAQGVPMSDPQDLWHASAMSSFGILVNKKIVALDKLPEPKTWDDLADPRLKENVLATDPRKSGTNSTMNMVVLQAKGWDAGYGLLTAIAANTKKFTQSSSDPVHGVVSGDAAAAMVIDFYGLGPAHEHGPERLSFTLPQGLTILDPDPVALVKNAPHRLVAERFVEFLMTTDAQKLWLLPKGAEGGPRRETLARLAVSPEAYKATEGRRVPPFDPFAGGQGFLKFDLAKSGLVREPLNDLVGVVMVDLHAELKKAWAAAAGDEKKIAALKVPLVAEQEFLAAAAKWDDQVFRNETINAWVKAAKARYADAASDSAH